MNPNQRQANAPINRPAILDANPLPAFLLARGVKLSANGTRANRCPHKEHSRGDAVSIEKEKGLWNCHVCNCGGSVVDWHAIEKGITPAAALKELAGTNGNGAHAPTSKRRIVATYDYVSESGEPLFQVARLLPKSFRQRRPDPAKPGAWLWNLEGVRRVLYRLPALATAETVWTFEGERDVESAERFDIIGTTNAGGAGKWIPDYSATLAGKHVIICGDTDAPGKLHVEAVARSLHGKAASVRVATVPAPSKDFTEYVEGFESQESAAAAVRALTDSAVPWQPKHAPTSNHVEPGTDDQNDLDMAALARSTNVPAVILKALTNGNIPAPQKPQFIANLVCSLLTKRGRFYFHAMHRDFPTAMFFDSETKRLLRVQADEFLSWLSHWTGINRAASLFRYVTAGVESAALTGKHTRGIIPETFWASRPGAIYLSNGDGQVVKITAGHVELVDNGTDDVLFTAGATLPNWTLTEAADPFETCALFRDANTIDPHGRTLLKLWFASLPSNPTCKPPLASVGQVRSGKTRTARGICELFGIPFRTVAPKDGDKALADFWTTMDGGGVFCADNVDSKIDWLPDALAAASTGVGDTRRKLYTDATQVELKPRAWLILTAANPLFASDVGLSDRLLVVRLGQRKGATSDETLSKQITEHRAAGLSWLAWTLAGALADTKPVPDGLNARHPDFATFAVRIGRALGIETEAVAALRAAETDKARFCLENDSAGAALLALLADGKSFAGTAAELLEVLAEYDPDFSPETTGARGNRLWTAKRLSKRLSAIWPHVEVVGVAIRETDRNHFTIYQIKPRPSAECAEFETLNRTNSICKTPTRSLAVSANDTPQTPQPNPELPLTAPQPAPVEVFDELI